MKRMMTLAALLLVLASFGILFSACRNEGWFVDKSQPWYENGHYHNTPKCGVHPVTHYITIMADKDDESYYSNSNSMGYYDTSFYKSKGYRYSKKKGHTYLTYPVSMPEYTCVYV